MANQKLYQTNYNMLVIFPKSVEADGGGDQGLTAEIH